MAFPAPGLPFLDDREGPVQHVISLGCRCSQASVYRALQKRRYACPFDWIFSSPQMVTHCLQDDFRSFLDRGQLYENGSSFDAIGLKPGSAPRERRFIGHKLYSTMTAGVGRGTIFNHRDPLHNEEDYLYTVRCVERFRLALASEERKLFVMLNLNRQLWLEAEIQQLFEELQRRSRNFLLLAVDCSAKNLGAAASPASLLRDVVATGGCRLVMCRVPCVGDNTGSYFREDADARRVQALLVEPFTFRLSPDPLEDRTGQGDHPGGQVDRPVAGRTPSAGQGDYAGQTATAGEADQRTAGETDQPVAGGQAAPTSGDSQVSSGYVEPKAVVRRWGRAR